jgi:hypothetical protein
MSNYGTIVVRGPRDTEFGSFKHIAEPNWIGQAVQRGIELTHERDRNLAQWHPAGERRSLNMLVGETETRQLRPSRTVR